MAFDPIGAVTFSGTVTLGAGLTALLILMATAFLIARSKAADTWRSEAEAERTGKERLQALAEERERTMAAQTDQIAQLTSVVETVGGSKVFEAVQEMQARMGELTVQAMAQMQVMAENHERRAEERHQSILFMFKTRWKEDDASA